MVYDNLEMADFELCAIELRSKELRTVWDNRDMTGFFWVTDLDFHISLRTL